jgi:hypothetical protein
LQVWPELDGVRRRVRLENVVVPAAAGDAFPLVGGGTARAFEVHHSVPSLGWSVTDADASRPVFVFAGDGTVLPFQEDPSLLDAELAVVDCSFVEEGTRVTARLGGHGHLMDWIELAPRLTCEVLVLAHLPGDLDAADLLHRLESIPAPRPVLVPWTAEPPRGS